MLNLRISDVVGALREPGLQREGSLHIEPVSTWLSQDGYDAKRRTPGNGADAVVWAEVTQRAYEDSELNWTYLSLMTLATLLASIAIVLDSQILVIGAMVLGPEFGAVAALGVALVRRRSHLLGLASRTLIGASPSPSPSPQSWHWGQGAGPGVRRRRRDLGQHPAAADQPDRNGPRRMGHSRPAADGLVQNVGQTGPAHASHPAPVNLEPR